tara:strand:- start:315 stop:488 length:174 start_codon:yes stop_codon:yes gene_type:complete
MVRTYTTTINVEVKTKIELLEILNKPYDHPFFEELSDEELNQCNIGKEKFYIKQIIK